MSLEVTSGSVAQAPAGIDPLKIPAGVDPTAFRAVLAAYSTAYRSFGRHPSVSEVHQHWPRIPQDAVGEILVAPEFRAALAGRGIVLGDAPGLSHVQHLVVMALSDPLDKRSVKAKLEACGATTQQYANWQRQPLFVAARRATASRLFEDSLDDIKTTMVQQAVAGSFQQQAFVLETLGEGPRNRESMNAMEIVQRFVSAISRGTLGHPEIRDAILGELRAEMTMLQVAQAAVTQ